jgi:dTDP-4-dehydrorhamnose reductase
LEESSKHVRIFITGHRGQLGRALQAQLAARNSIVEGGDLPDWEMTNPSLVGTTLKAFRPDAVIHTAALTNVDYCAEHPAEAVRINGVGTHNVALACREVDTLLVAISTNEVFDGKSGQAYQEFDPRSPINPYGYSKFVAEEAVEKFAARYMIIRTAWLYAPGGANFVHKIIGKAQAGTPLSVVTDEISTPTNVSDLADAIVRLIETDRPGIYHLTNAGECSRYAFAQEILRLRGLDVPITPITLADFKRPSSPPPYAPLANVFAAAAGIEMRPWQQALADYMKEHEGQP